MQKIRNEHTIDRLLRVLVGTALAIIGFFWFGGTSQIVFMVFATILILTGLTGFCALYKVLGVNTCSASGPAPRWIIGLFFVLLGALLAGGTYASIFFSTKFFLEDYNHVNNFYKQTLFNTGQGKRAESEDQYNELVKAYEMFTVKYSSYRPYVLRADTVFTTDLVRVGTTLAGLEGTIATGDLHEAHLTLETVRPIFQDMLKRNGFSMLAVSLVDFHDAMEEVITSADAKDATGVLSAYDIADVKLQAVEAEAKDVEVQAIRTNLEAVRALAESSDVEALPAKAAELKASFVKVYLVRG
ncbi:MAG: DUF2892 domain-containing protein [Candidatus Pacebacteria bacterium]|nr:DUF2892 domain-containing protein [Candidatus Paceibacterota bacterium]